MRGTMELGDVQKNWNRFGEIDPLYFILTDKSKRGRKWDTKEFFESGVREVDEVLRRAASLGLSIDYGRALDFGCGVGRLTQRLGDYFREVSGVDIASSMLRRAAEYNRHGSRCAYLLNTADNLCIFGDGTFDFIYSDITLQHMEPRYAKSYIKEFLRVLKRSGLAVFQIPSEPTPLLRVRQHAYPLGGLVRALPAPLQRCYYRLRYHYRPVLETYGIKKDELIEFITAHGGKVVAAEENDPVGKKWRRCRYFVTRAIRN